MSTGLDRLSPEHLLMLRQGSGLTDEVIIERGYYTATTFKELRDLGFTEKQSRAPALVIPLYNVDGRRVSYQIRPDAPRASDEGKTIKYETPRGAKAMLDVPPRCQPQLADPSIPLYVTEGSKKADALAARGACAVSVSGVWNFRGTNAYGGKMTLPDWDGIALNERLVRVVYDSDAMTKRPVALAMSRLKAMLERKEAFVEVVNLPPGDAGKVGVDDFLAQAGSIEDLGDFVRTKVEIPPHGDALPEVVVSNRAIREVAEECWKLLLEANNPHPVIFVRAGALVRIDSASDSPVIRGMAEDDVISYLDRKADFVRLVKVGDEVVAKPVPLRRDVARDIVIAWSKPLPPLKAVVSTPIVEPDGTVQVRPGYQPTSEIYYAPQGPPVPAVPEVPSEEDLSRALALLNDWLCDFPFAEVASRTNAIAMVLTYLCREMFGGPTPLFGIDAPTQGTGKGLLAATAGIVMEGRVPPVTTEPRDGDEWRKRITARLIEGAGIMLIDNVKRRLDSAELAAAVTSEWWNDRLLGKSESISVPNRAVWIATGNNLKVDGEVGRRTVSIRLDARRDRPWEGRVFRHADLPEWARETRHELVWALLVLVRRWVAVGMPPWTGSAMGSYEPWCRVIGGILDSAGIGAFLGNRERLYERADAETQEWRELTRAWWDRHEDRPVKVHDIALLVQEQELLVEFLGVRGEFTVQGIKIKLGKALSSRIDRRFGELILRDRGIDRHQKGRVYGLELAEDASGPNGPSADSPRENDLFSDSQAEDAESAEGDSEPRARDTSPNEHAKSQAPPGMADCPPHSPHPPQSNSERGRLGAEDRAENSAEDRCVDCGLGLSVLNKTGRCGPCNGMRVRG